MAGGENHAPIIIKKVKKGGGHGHHGGAWKVAYADFVTAMMAFFLLLWLLASTSEEQREGIADYFTPSVVTDSNASGAGGILGGQTVTTDGVARDTRAPMGFVSGTAEEESDRDDGDTPPSPSEMSDDSDFDDTFDGMTPDQVAAAEAKAEEEREEFDKIAAQLRNTLASVPELSDLSENLLIDQTPEGLRIQIVDRQNRSMFASGSALPLAHTRTLLNLVADAVKSLPNEVAIKGHTDAAPFRSSDGGYSNWELSSDRAHASRRALLASGLPTQRVAYVVGKADREPLNSEDPFDAANRRISIVLLRDGLTEAQAEGGAPIKIEPAFEPPPLFERSERSDPPAATQVRETADGGPVNAAANGEVSVTPTAPRESGPAETTVSTSPAETTVSTSVVSDGSAPADPFANVLTFGN